MCPLGLSLLVGRKKNGGRAEIFCFMVIYCPDMVEREKKRKELEGGNAVNCKETTLSNTLVFSLARKNRKKVDGSGSAGRSQLCLLSLP